MGRLGPLTVALVDHWPQIAGEDLARFTFPRGIAFPGRQQNNGRLELDVKREQAVFLAHRTDEILARVNRFFGASAVGTVRLTQVDRLPVPAPRKPAPVPETVNAPPLEDFDHGPLAQALSNLKAAVHEKDGKSE